MAALDFTGRLIRRSHKLIYHHIIPCFISKLNLSILIVGQGVTTVCDFCNIWEAMVVIGMWWASAGVITGSCQRNSIIISQA